MLRRIAEHISRGKELKRCLPKEVGKLPIVVSPEAGGLRYWRRNLAKADPELIGLACEFVQPGFVVWDVGANQGIFSFSAAWRAGPRGLVIAIEPDIRLAALLSKSSALSANLPRAPITIVPLAVSDSVGLRQFHVARRARASNHLEGFGNTQSGGTRQISSVLTITLDWLARHLPTPQLLKIDVEGAELSVLRGASELLQRHKPILICEVNAQSSVKAASVLRSFGYAIYDGSAKPTDRRGLNKCPWSTIAIPEERGASERIAAAGRSRGRQPV